MKRLYNDEDNLTKEGLGMREYTKSQLEPIFKNIHSKGYSIRDLSHIVIKMASELENDYNFMGIINKQE